MGIFESIWYEIWKYLEDNYFSATVGDRYSYISFDGSTGTTLFSIMLGLCLGMMVASYFLLYQRNRIGRFVRRILKAGAKTPGTAKSLEELGLEKDAAVKHALRTPSVLRKLVHIVTPKTILIRNLYENEITEEMVAKEYARISDEKEKEKIAVRAAIEEEKELRRERAAMRMSTNAGTLTVTAEEPSEAPEARPLGTAVSANEEKKEDGTDLPANEKAAAETNSARAKGPSRLPKFDFATARFYIPEELCFRAERRFARDKFGLPAAIIATVVFLVLTFLLVRLAPLVLGFFDRSLTSLFG